MLPTRAYTDTLSSVAPATTPRAPLEERPVIVVAVDRSDVDRFPSSSYTRLPAHTTAEAISLIERVRPRVVAVDLDTPGLDADQVIRAARRFPHTSVLVTSEDAERAPAAIKAGCHAVLLEPFGPSLTAARIGRLCREMPMSTAARRVAAALHETGTHRVWPNTACPKCNTLGATSFEFSSYRRMWYACLACDAVWLGPRQE